MSISKDDTETMDISLKAVPKSLVENIDNLARAQRRSRNAQTIILLEEMMKIILGQLESQGYMIKDGEKHKLTQKGEEALRERLRQNKYP